MSDKYLPNIGHIAGDDAQRDAIHIAVAPVVAGERLYPGQHVAFEDGSAERVRPFGTTIGIVDPFHEGPILPEQRFWMFLYPNTITSLRHDWTHPAFAQDARTYVPAGASDSERRIREIADALDIGYAALMEAADTWLRYEDYTVQHGSENWRDDFPGYAVEFWKHYEIVTGAAVAEDKRESFFSCSC